MDEGSRPFVVAARSLGDVAPIDGGDTVAVTLRGADSGGIVLLLPRHLAQDLGAQLARAAGEPDRYGLRGGDAEAVHRSSRPRDG
ncbi:hypothetical protein [Methylobacterium dankookense]|nr:hypothetical protein [Methylobacterium dankookense]